MSVGANEGLNDPPRNSTLVEDPLVAALPPSTDYITYLTILEYQLKPQNIQTLNRLLQEDDGTLAAEIGWDLLKLVLPILRVEPTKAKECLEIVARRGNPREVIVKVSEELENLGHNDSEGEADPQDHEDGLPTFAGEAPRVHLGEMALAGMPTVPQSEKLMDESDVEGQVPDAAIEELKLQSLLSMLSLLHPRIKTQYPSRFLATSLPAALGAYRRLSMCSESTTAFLNSLFKLVNKQRPALPPRVSTSSILETISSQVVSSTPIIPAPLPDPESKTESQTELQATAENENAINQRLVQAVFFEILDEFTAASSEAQPPLTARLRAQFEPQSLTSSRRAELLSTITSPTADSAHALRKRFVSTANDLQINIKTEILNLDKPKSELPEQEEEHEYPSSPSQIPFSNTGLLFLRCAQVYLQAVTERKPPHPPVNLQHILPTILRSWTNDTRFKQSAPAVDSLLSMLYIGLCVQAPPPSNAPFVDQAAIQSTLLAIYDILRDTFTNCPDADLRDNAHHIATHLLHGHATRETRTKIIRDLLETPNSSSPGGLMSFGAQPGSLKSLSVDWLKAELYPTQMVKTIMSKNREDFEPGLPATKLGEFADLLFPDLEAAKVVPQSTGKSKSKVSDEEQKAIDAFATELPFYISSLNLLSVAAKGTGSKETGTIVATEPSNSADVSAQRRDAELDSALARGKTMLANLEVWMRYLNEEYSVAAASRSPSPDGSNKRKRDGTEHIDVIERTEVFALEDAIGRVREVLGQGDEK
ncbi:YAP1-binding protein 1 [Neophaeococcomyces mojaviensis]|uniref:YAP1-binding protein 1 n=1 Tax=Neophaeococcomyces mojaviensis TaxID=3383035 RepID=A0ACC2ZZ72_9EURO|nr:YAP1-binding protein 1 [Knufia sp. JES_112]